jgi:DNA-damage-inducible protein J
MSKTSQIRVRIEDDIKDKASAILGELGLTISDAVSIYMKRIVKTGGIPFELRLPTQELREAIAEYEHNETHVIDDFDSNLNDITDETN